jgi:hypothetical protein
MRKCRIRYPGNRSNLWADRKMSCMAFKTPETKRKHLF